MPHSEVTCGVCRKQPASWAWEPFSLTRMGHVFDPMTFPRPKRQQRDQGTVVPLCAQCHRAVSDGDNIVFRADGRTWSASHMGRPVLCLTPVVAGDDVAPEPVPDVAWRVGTHGHEVHMSLNRALNAAHGRNHNSGHAVWVTLVAPGEDYRSLPLVVTGEHSNGLTVRCRGRTERVSHAQIRRLVDLVTDPGMWMARRDFWGHAEAEVEWDGLATHMAFISRIGDVCPVGSDVFYETCVAARSAALRMAFVEYVISPDLARSFAQIMRCHLPFVARGLRACNEAPPQRYQVYVRDIVDRTGLV